jgi:hypothetical protein
MGLRMGLRIGLRIGQKIGLRMGQKMGQKMGLRIGLRIGQKMGLRIGLRIGQKMGLRIGLRIGLRDGLIVIFWSGIWSRSDNFFDVLNRRDIAPHRSLFFYKNVLKIIIIVSCGVRNVHNVTNMYLAQTHLARAAREC